MVTLGLFTVPGATEVTAKLGYCVITTAGRKVMCPAGILILEAAMEIPFLSLLDLFSYVFF